MLEPAHGRRGEKPARFFEEILKALLQPLDHKHFDEDLKCAHGGSTICGS